MNQVAAREYLTAAKQPFGLLRRFVSAARESEIWPTAAVLATVTESGLPTARPVLTSLDTESIVFGANSQSPKVHHILASPAVELCYVWPSLGAQTRVTGVARLLSPRVSDSFFSDLPDGIKDVEQLNALGATILDLDYEEIVESVRKQRDARPQHWRAVRIEPTEYRFWVSFDDTHRLSVVVTCKEEGWAPIVVAA